MVDFKEWLSEATGEPVEETVFLPENYTTLPMICFTDDVDHGGADGVNNLIRHQLFDRKTCKKHRVKIQTLWTFNFLNGYVMF